MARGQMSKMNAKTQASEGNLASLTPKQLKEQANLMRKLTPNALRRRNPNMKNMSDLEIKQAIEHMEALANDPELREQSRKQYASSGSEMRELQQLSKKKPDDMTAEEMSKMFRLQRDVLRDNPDSFWNAMSQTPQMANISREDMAKSINQMADMEPEELQQYLSMQKSVGPLVSFIQKVEIYTGGYSRFVVIGIVALFVYWLIRKIFLRV